MRCRSLPKVRAGQCKDEGDVAGNRSGRCCYEQISRDRLRLQQKDSEFEWAAQRPHAGRAARGGEDLPACPASREFRPFKNQEARLHGPRFLDWQLCDSELEAHRGYLRMDDDYLRVLTLKEMPSATHPLLLNGAARHSGELPRCYRMASRR